MIKNSLPLVLFLLLVILLAVGLKLDPREVPSPYIDKPAPSFTLPKLYENTNTISPEDMKGKVWLLNVWASWCGACRAEHQVLNRVVKNHQLKIVGLNYKNDSSKAKQWLEDLGNPYVSVAVDRAGHTGIDWGVYGVPETFVIDKQGIIRYKNIGPVNQSDIDNTIIPLILELQQRGAS
ncbi:MAG: DsbE family thiol:disulfide interchange protein [Methylophagaceae bacterium]